MYWGYVIVAYAIAALTLGSYTAWILRRGRALSRRLPEDKRRFLD
jgi:heme exporter protein CcmD